MLQFSLVFMLQNRWPSQKTRLMTDIITFGEGNSTILNQDGKTKILSCVACFYSKCLAKMKNERRAWQCFLTKKSLLGGRRRRPLDSRTRTTRRTRLNEKYFGVFSKKLIPRKGFIALFPPESWRCIDSFYQLFTPLESTWKGSYPISSYSWACKDGWNRPLLATFVTFLCRFHCLWRKERKRKKVNIVLCYFNW